MLMSLVFLGCDGDPPTDAGPQLDAGADAGPMDAGSMDAGAPDAAPPDAGPDAGPDPAMLDAGPPPVSELGADVMANLGTLETAVSGVPAEMRLDGAFLDIDVGSAGVNAIIGETGLMTLALSDATVRALADLQQCNAVLDILDSAHDALSDAIDPSLVAVRDQLTTLIDSLTAYRDGVARLYRERLDAGIIGTPVVIDPFSERLNVRTTGSPLHLRYVIEGASASMESASLELSCFADDPVTVTVVQEDTGAELATASGAGFVPELSVPAPFDTPTAVDVIIETTPSSGVWEGCNAWMTSRRSLRADPVIIDMSQGGSFAMAIADWHGAVSYADSTYLTAVTDAVIPASTLTAVRDQIAMLFDLVASITPDKGAALPLETIQNVSRRMVYVAAMFDAMVASPALAGEDGFGLRDALGALKGTAQELVLAVSSPAP
jgi:hypothetical protein